MMLVAIYLVIAQPLFQGRIAPKWIEIDMDKCKWNFPHWT